MTALHHQVVMTSRPVGQEGHCFVFVDLHPGHVKSSVFSQNLTTTNFSKKFFLQFSNWNSMFYHESKNQSANLFSYANMDT